MLKKQIYIFISLISLSCILTSCSAENAPASTVKSTNSAQISENISKADQLFTQREDVAKLRQAVELLDQVRQPDARNYEVEWKYSKYSYFLGTQLSDEKKSDQAFTDGAAAAQIAQRLEPNKPDGYFWYAANLGEQAKRSPLTVGIKSVDPIRAAMSKVIEIQPDYQGASAYDALGQLELETKLMGGDDKKALEYLEKGVAIEKENSYLRLHLAQAYLAVDRKPEAKKQLEYILQMKIDPEFAFEYKQSADEAKKLLETKF